MRTTLALLAVCALAAGCTSVSSGQKDKRTKKGLKTTTYELDATTGRTNRIIVQDTYDEGTEIRTRGHAYAAGSSGQNIQGFQVRQDPEAQGFGLMATQKSDLDKTIESVGKLNTLLDSFKGTSTTRREVIPPGMKLVPADDPSQPQPEIP